MSNKSIVLICLFILFGFLSANAQDDKGEPEKPNYFINQAAGEISELFIAIPDKSTSPLQLFKVLRKYIGKGSKGVNRSSMLAVINFPMAEKPNTFELFDPNQTDNQDETCKENRKVCFFKALNEILTKYDCKKAPLHFFAIYNGCTKIITIMKNHKLSPAKLTLLAPPLGDTNFEQTFNDVTTNLDSPETNVYFTSKEKAPIKKFSEIINSWDSKTNIFSAELSSKSVFFIVNEIMKPRKVKKFNKSKITAQVPKPEVDIKIFDTKNNKVISYADMIKDLAKKDVVFFGEQHDSVVTHRLEANVLTGLYSQRKNLAVTLEMFERDVQGVLDNYLGGKINEREFLKTSRPWGNYFSGYKALIEFSKAHKLPVIAANVPRKYASMISRQGIDSLEKLPEAERGFCARELKVLDGAYKDRFFDTMKRMGASGHSKMLDAMFAAQSLKDDTMAESIYDFLVKNKDTLAIHYNGAFHSDYTLGTAEKLALLNPKLKIGVLSAIPVENLEDVNIEEVQGLADYVVLIKLESISEDF